MASAARQRLVLGGILLVALAIRLTTWRQVFVDGRILLDGPDAYYHLRRAALTVEHWPRVPQLDPLLNFPAGGFISWPPLFDGLLATLALPWKANARHALEMIGAFIPPILGVLVILMLYRLVAGLWSRRAATAAALTAAVLPASVRYTLLGALDHDPFFELAVLIALGGMAAALRLERWSWRPPAWVSAGLGMAILGWGGSIMAIGLTALVAFVILLADPQRGRWITAVVAVAASSTALIILPFVLWSPWTETHRFTHEGLSLLHETALAAVAFSGAVLALLLRAHDRRLMLGLGVVSGLALVILLPPSLQSFVAGTRYAAGDAPILKAVAEARPLLFLFGPFDPRPMLVRLGLLPLAALLLTVKLIRTDTMRVRAALLAVWLAVTLTLALLHSRFTFSAALSLCAFAGVAWDFVLRNSARARSAHLAAALILLPGIAAYTPVPGWLAHNFYLRENNLRQYEMDRLCEALRSRPQSGAADGVLAPWYFGHWVLWIAEKGVVLSPMLSVGQSEFVPGMRFFFLEDEDQARRFLQSHRVRYLVVTPELETIETRARISGIDPERYLRRNPESVDLRAYMRTIAARLTFWGTGGIRALGEEHAPLEGYREILRSSVFTESPFGPVPLVRIYEMTP